MKNEIKANTNEKTSENFEETLKNSNERKLKKLQGNLANAVPLKRSGEASDIAEAALYLASDAGVHSAV